MRRLERVLLCCLLGWVTWTVGCADEDGDLAAPINRQRPTVLAVDAAIESPDAGCARAQTLLSADGCRVDWQCGGGVARTLFCAPSDAGFLCGCAEGEDGFGSDAGLQPECTEPANLPGIARRVCGWDVP